MERKTFWEQLWLGLRALAVITVMLTTAGVGQAWADGVKYIDADGNEQTCTNYTVLTGGGATTLPGGWYTAQGEVAYTGQLRFNGDAHIILADGCNMTVGTEVSPISGTAIFANNCNLTIYGQGGETEGKLTAAGGIYTYRAGGSTITINGGQVTATGGTNGITCISSSVSTITINGGQVTATGSSYGIYAQSSSGSANVTINGGQVTATDGYNGIYASCSSGSVSVTITGGQVTATGSTNGIFASCSSGSVSITLGWKNSTDFIKVSSYKAETGPSGTASVKTTAGKRFVAYNMASEDDISANCIIGSTTGETKLNNINIGNISGKTLRPLDGYYMAVPAGTIVSGKTDADGKAKPDFTISDIPYYIYKEGASVGIVTNDYGHDGVEITGTNVPATVTVNDARTLATFDMPAGDVTINGMKYYIENTGVDYMDWDVTQKKLVSKNTATDDNDANDKVYVLTGGGATTLPGGWYIAEGEVAYTSMLRFAGNVCLILADGCKMTVTNNSGEAIYGNKTSITIYGQSTDEKTMGSLTAISEKRAGIFANMDYYNGDITINGGIITAKGRHGIHSQHTGNTANGSITINGGKVIASGSTTDGSGIWADNNSGSGSHPSVIINGGEVIASNSVDYIASISADNITITGGHVEANNTRGTGIWANITITITGGQVEASGGTNGFGLCSNIGDITITGGQVEVSGGNYGIYAYNSSGSANITLGWTNAEDYIYASGYGIYGTGTVTTAAGKAMKAFIPAATEGDSDKPFAYIAGGHTLTATELTALAGKKLVPNPDGLTYMDWDDSQKKLVSKNTLTDGNTANDFVYVLQGGGATELPGGWYVAEGDVTYTGQLRFAGNVCLILADGCEMTVGTEDSPTDTYAISASSLIIYGQGGETEGSLTAIGKQRGISNDRLTINGGQVTATGTVNGIDTNSESVSASVTINGGQLTATGGTSGNGIYAYSDYSSASVTINGGQVKANGGTARDGIYAYSDYSSASVTINGGQVTATGGTNGSGIYAKGSTASSITINGGQVTAPGGTDGIFASCSSGSPSITLGWTNADDYIMASNYKINGTGDVKIAAGKRFVAYNMASEDDISANCIIGSTTSETTLNNINIGNISGKTLRPLDGYYMAVPTGTIVSGKTDADGKPKPDFTIGTTPYYIYKAGDEVTLTFKDYGQDGVEVSGLPIDLAVTDRVPTIDFQMRNEDEKITSKYYIENTGVDYLDWDVTQKKLVNKNTKDLSPTPKVYFLMGGGATTLDGGWYVVNDWNTILDKDNNSIDAAYTGQLKFTGDAHLILADGSEMTVTNTATGESAIYGDNASLTICAQSEGEGMGDLLAINYNSDGIYVNATGSGDAGITINSGIVGSIGQYHGFYAKSSGGNATVTVNGGEIHGGNDGFVAESASGNATVTFNGGLVNAAGGTDVTIGATSISGNATVAINGGQINSDVSGQPIVARSNFGAAKIILGWTAPSDYIQALKYIVSDGGTVSVADGQYLADYSLDKVDNVYSGTLDDTELGAIARQTLYPAMPIAGGEKYVSVCSTNGDWKLMDGVKAYVVTGYDTTTGTVTLSEAPLGGLPNGVPVILMKDADGDGSPDGNLGATFTLVGADTTEAENIENSVPTTISPLFTAGDGTKTMAQLIFEATGSNDTSDYLVFVLEKGVFKMAAFSDDQVPSADKCFLIVSKLDVLLMIRNGVAPAAAAGARTIAFDLGGSDDTGIERLTFGSSLNGGEWYDLQGRRLDVSPKQKGVYIYQGKKVVIK